MKRARIYTPTTRLQRLVTKAGGRTRDDAVALAAANVEALRGDSSAEIAAAVGQLEQAFASATLNEETVRQVFALLDRVVTLASHFGFDRLRAVCNQLASLMLSVSDYSVLNDAVVGVYLRAMHLFGPGGPTLSDTEASAVIAALLQVRTRLVGEAAPAPVTVPDPVAAAMEQGS